MEVAKFIEENFAIDSIDELKNCIMQIEIKNALQYSTGRVPKFNLKIYAFVYDMFIFHIVTHSMKLLPLICLLLMFIA